MAQVSIKINGRTYEVACDDGQEEHVQRMGRYIDTKVKELAGQIGQVGDSRLLVMAALLITDELSEAYGEVADLREEMGNLPDAPEAGAEAANGAAGAEDAESLRRLAQRIEDIAAGLEQA